MSYSVLPSFLSRPFDRRYGPLKLQHRGVSVVRRRREGHRYQTRRVSWKPRTTLLVFVHKCSILRTETRSLLLGENCRVKPCWEYGLASQNDTRKLAAVQLAARWIPYLRYLVFHLPSR